jgi:hypothetical protein
MCAVGVGDKLAVCCMLCKVWSVLCVLCAVDGKLANCCARNRNGIGESSYFIRVSVNRGWAVHVRLFSFYSPRPGTPGLF